MKQKILTTRAERIGWMVGQSLGTESDYQRHDDVEIWKMYIQCRYSVATVNTVDDVKAFFADLIAGNLIFHPDTNFKDYVIEGHGCDNPLFSPEDFFYLERVRARCFQICAKAGHDAIYALAVECAEEAGGMPQQLAKAADGYMEALTKAVGVNVANCPHCNISTPLDKLTPVNIERGSVQCPACRNFFQLEDKPADSIENVLTDMAEHLAEARTETVRDHKLALVDGGIALELLQRASKFVSFKLPSE